MDSEKEKKVNRLGKILSRYLPDLCGYVKFNFNKGRFENWNIYETKKPNQKEKS